MAPHLRAGDLALLRPARDVAVGDVVLYESTAGARFLHRIVGERGDAFVTQGDANPAPDAAVVRPEQIEAQQVGRVPFVGKLLALGRTPAGTLALLALPCAWFLARERRPPAGP